jgi:hypothetical protein
MTPQIVELNIKTTCRHIQSHGRWGAQLEAALQASAEEFRFVPVVPGDIEACALKQLRQFRESS